MPPLTIATGNYGLTRPLKQGEVRSAMPLEFVEVKQITTDGMRPMVRSLAFDACEMAFTTYLCARAMGKPFTAIPLFLTRNFHHWAAFYNVKSGITGPKDLEGRRVGVNRGYTVTTGLWNRGILQHEYGVDIGKVVWCPTDEEHVSEFKAPANVDYRFMGGSCATLLASGELDAAVGDIPVTSPDVRPLIPNAREAGYAWYAKTGIFPLNHGLVVKNSALQSEPQVAVHLFEAFSAAKKVYLDHLRTERSRDEADALARSLAPVVGGDPFPYGVAANRRAIETIVTYAFEQHVIPKRFAVEELFAPNTLGLS